MPRVLAVVAVCLTATSASAQDIAEAARQARDQIASDTEAEIPLSTGEILDRFRLFTNCSPMAVEIRGAVDEGIGNLVVTRLRAARLYSEEIGSLPLLRVGGVTSDEPILLLTIEFLKQLYDYESGTGYLASTWQQLVWGGADTAMQNTASELMDEFLMNYVRVNEDACGS